ncbi:cell division protein FtsZ [Methylophilaceae bacterium]|uniref:Cell division protein FtsZ n=1 Tax=Methylophilales bacterium HTCC2181 TaxID=383631 RepID=A0P5L3_9PROT|nr:cell division protein FtsZ [Methylophilales bacterium HTCC2181]MCH9781658.1 cell division protein FtsZ [Betaproteobacteria bacterium]MDC0115533.1 cell division protein FtsZ [Methylophilaceae bacterium]
MFEIVENKKQKAVIKVIGVGGCGGNAIDYMIEKNVMGVDFICANTDLQALQKSQASTIVQIGEMLTQGLGAGSRPDTGKQAAIDDKEKIIEAIDGADMLFITAGMGGGTGTGATPVIAQIAKELGILTVAVVTKPFDFEGRRTQVAKDGINELVNYVDSLITIPNEKLMGVLGDEVTFVDAFGAANEVLYSAVLGIAEIINNPGMINVDFADVRTVMGEMGMAMIGSGFAEGSDRAEIAAKSAVACPLLEDVNLNNAKGILVNISASRDFKMKEYFEIMDIIKQFASDNATIIVGNVIDESMSNSIRVTMVATGLTGSFSVEDKDENVMQAFVYDDESSNKGIEDNKNDESINVFSDSEDINRHSFSSDSDDQYDVPAFLRKK